MKKFEAIQNPIELNLLVAFSDLAGFAKMATKIADKDVFSTMSDFFEFAGDIVEKANGKIVKFVGDAMLIVFPEESSNEGIEALKQLQIETDRWMQNHHFNCQMHVKAHFGPVVCGPIGTKNEKRFDVYGAVVNTAALIKSKGFAMTAQAFRTLDSKTRKLFKKHTPPITYISVEESHGDKLTNLRNS